MRVPMSMKFPFRGPRTYLAGDTSGDDNNLDTFEGLIKLVCGEALDLKCMS